MAPKPKVAEKPTKDDKEKKDKDEKKEKKKRIEPTGFSLWDSTEAEKGTFIDPYQNQAKKPQNKRDLKAEAEKGKVAAAGVVVAKPSDVVAGLLQKKKDDQTAKKKEAEQKEVAAKAKAKKEMAEEDARAENFQIMDKDGLGNFMDKSSVTTIMKESVATAVSTTAGARCQVVTKLGYGERVFVEGSTIFESVGGFRFVEGFIFVRGHKDDIGCNMVLTRPCTVFVCCSENPNQSDAYLPRWDDIEPEERERPEFQDGTPPIVTVKRKKFNDRNAAIPKPPKDVKVCLVFVVPDFHANVFGEEEKSEEQLLEEEKQQAADRRANKATGKDDKKKKEPSAEEKLQDVLAKVEKGEKLNNKEKRIYEKHQEKEEKWEVHHEDEVQTGGLQAFTLTLEGGKNEPPPSGDAMVCENWSLSAPGQLLFDNASLTITRGKRYGILGPNGQGKTTLLRHLKDRQMPIPLNWDVILVEQEAKASDRTAVDEVLAADEKVLDLLAREKELVIQLEAAAENDDDELDFEKVRMDLAQVTADLEASGADTAEARVRKILCGLGFTNGDPDKDRFSMERPVVQFSGGWRMRISLAKALFLQPELLMLDEPTNHLDLDAVLWLDDYLSTQYPHAVIVVSHDAHFLDCICTDILHLEDKKLLHYRGDYTDFKKMYEQLKAGREKDYDKQQYELKALKKKGKTKEQAEAAVKAKFGLDARADLTEKRKDYIVKFQFHGHGMDHSIGGVNTSDVAFSYNGKEPWLLEDCDIGIDCASRIAIVGPNGAGKSTLLNLMMEQLEPCKGEVSATKGIRVKQYHQHFEELLDLKKDPVEYLSSVFDLSPPEKARAILGQFGLPGSSHYTKIGNLSGGQKARVAFSCLMLQKPHIIVLDEPTNHLDIESVAALATAVKNFNGGCVLVSHDARLITEIDCELWVVEGGTCYRFDKGFEGYKDKVMDDLRERQEEVERLELKRRKERQERRAKQLQDEVLQAARRKLALEEAARKEAEEEASRKFAEEAAERAKKAEAKDSSEEDKDSDDSDESDSDDEAKEKAKQAAEKKRKLEEMKRQLEEEEAQLAAEAEAKKAKKKEKATKKTKTDEEGDEEKQTKNEAEVDEDGKTTSKSKEKAKTKKQLEQEEEDRRKAEEAVEEARLKAETEELKKSVVVEVEEDDNLDADLDPDAQHPEFKVAEVVDVRPVKKKAGFFWYDLDVGDDDYLSSVSNYPNAKAGDKVIVAPAGSKVGGVKMKPSMIHGVHNECDLCGPKEMEWNAKGWQGKAALDCVILDSDFPVGSAAPAYVLPSSGTSGGTDEDDIAKKKKAAAKAKALAVAHAKKEEEEEDDEEAKASKKKGSAAGGGVSRSKAKKEQAKALETTEEEAGKGKKKKGKKGDDDDDDDEAAAVDVKKKQPTKTVPETSQDGGDANAKHSEYKVAEVISVEPIKKKKGFYIAEVSLGSDPIAVVTGYNVEGGDLIILAPEGSSVSGKEVKRQKQQGEWSAGVVCGPMEMGWTGTADQCVKLDFMSYTVGEAAPANPAGVKAAEGVDLDAIPDDAEEDEEEEAVESDQEEKKGKQFSKKGKAATVGAKAAPKAGAKKANDSGDEGLQTGPATKSTGKKAHRGDDVEDEKKAPAPKARGKKGKKKDEDDDDVFDGPAPVAPKAKAKSKPVASDSESDGDVPAPKSAAKKGFAAFMADSDESESEEESEDEAPPPPKPTKERKPFKLEEEAPKKSKKTVEPPPKAKKSKKYDTDSDDDVPTAKPKKVSKKVESDSDELLSKAKPKKVSKKVDAEDDIPKKKKGKKADSDSEDEPPPVKAKKSKKVESDSDEPVSKAKPKKVSKKVESDDDAPKKKKKVKKAESDSDDDPPATSKAKKSKTPDSDNDAPPSKAKAKKSKKADSDSEDEPKKKPKKVLKKVDSDSDDEPKKKPKKASKKAESDSDDEPVKKVKKKSKKEESDSDSDSDKKKKEKKEKKSKK
mmetsp:Transcript_14332/g.39034  ORF Transcript_14332/g.39034 Transcript_14332/m.39034 type:complete len:1959 (-) Transcript_14332:208-6084(-)